MVLSVVVKIIFVLIMVLEMLFFEMVNMFFILLVWFKMRMLNVFNNLRLLD